MTGGIPGWDATPPAPEASHRRVTIKRVVTWVIILILGSMAVASIDLLV